MIAQPKRSEQTERAQAETHSMTLAKLGSTLALLFGVVCYVAFFGAFAYLAAFVENMGVPMSIDAGRVAFSIRGVVIDLALFGLFAAQHSIMARPGFKALWTRVVPRSVERSVYVLLTSLALLFLCWQWRPLTGVVWQVSDPVAKAALLGLSLAGWALAVVSSFLIDHFDLIGLRQVYLAWRRRQHTNHPFRITALYRFTRHPLMLGFLIAFWATPRMTIGHLLFALMTTGYILAAVRFLEERDLVASFGEAYVDYRRRVPMIVPFTRWRRS